MVNSSNPHLHLAQTNQQIKNVLKILLKQQLLVHYPPPPKITDPVTVSMQLQNFKTLCHSQRSFTLQTFNGRGTSDWQVEIREEDNRRDKTGLKST